MKGSNLFSILTILASSSALPTELHERSWPFDLLGSLRLPGFPGLGGATTSAAATPTPTPTAHTTTAIVSTTTPAPTTSTTYPTPTPTITSSSTGSSSGSIGGDTENGVVNGECKEVTVIFARGTSESGNVGTVAGPPMFSSLRSSLGDDKVTVQGEDYPATWAGNANQGGDGGPTMASLVQQALSQCPQTRIVLSGYSQGAMVVHNAVAQQGVSASQVAAVVLFGDPMNGSMVGGVPSSKVLELCASGDDVCDGSGTFAITQAHLTYGSNAQQAADFIIDTVGLS